MMLADALGNVTTEQSGSTTGLDMLLTGQFQELIGAVTSGQIEALGGCEPGQAIKTGEALYNRWCEWLHECEAGGLLSDPAFVKDAFPVFDLLQVADYKEGLLGYASGNYMPETLIFIIFNQMARYPDMLRNDKYRSEPECTQIGHLVNLCEAVSEEMPEEMKQRFDADNIV